MQSTFGTIVNHVTGEHIRPATKADLIRSLSSVQGQGVIRDWGGEDCFYVAIKSGSLPDWTLVNDGDSQWAAPTQELAEAFIENYSLESYNDRQAIVVPNGKVDSYQVVCDAPSTVIIHPSDDEPFTSFAEWQPALSRTGFVLRGSIRDAFLSGS